MITVSYDWIAAKIVNRVLSFTSWRAYDQWRNSQSDNVMIRTVIYA
jgi:hypothetical protein